MKMFVNAKEDRVKVFSKIISERYIMMLKISFVFSH